MWNTTVKLLKGYKGEKDKDGVTKKVPIYLSNIMASAFDTTRSDEILAKTLDYSVDKSYEMLKCNYNGSKILIDETDNSEYEVKRSYSKDKSNKVTLLCQRREKNVTV